jgi:hypothetical protein
MHCSGDYPYLLNFYLLLPIKPAWPAIHPEQNYNRSLPGTFSNSPAKKEEGK